MAQGTSSSSRGPRKPRGVSPRKTPSSGFSLTPAQQEQLAALALLVIAALTFLGAVNPTNGSLLDGWTRVLAILFGWGRYLAPFFFAGLGAWLMLDSLDMRPDIGWERPLALIILFFVLASSLQILGVAFMQVAPTSLATAQSGQGGGLIGHALYDLMVGGLGLAGAMLVLAVLGAIGLILLFNIPLSQIIGSITGALESVRERFANRSSQIKLTREGRERVPTEMVTAPPRERTPETRRLPANDVPRLPVDFGMDEQIEQGALPVRPSVAARIVGGGAPTQPVMHREWRLPRIPDILEESIEQEISATEIRTKVKQIEETLAHFGVPAKVVEVNQGPTITQFGVEPGFLQQKAADGSMRQTKVKVNRISGLQHDLELALAAAPIRVEAPVPGKSMVGIEVPNSQISLVSLRSVMESEEFQRMRAKSALAFALGQDVSGQPIVADLAKMPHLLVAGATGSGKSVAVNAMITCMIMTNTPDELQFVMVDPKRVELSTFNGIPHLLAPVVVEMDLAVAALNRTVQEMDDRYRKFSHVGARNLENYNALTEEKRRGPKMPYLILVVDELADLMMTSPDEVEHTVTRLAQMARATGIHLVLATQRPSVDVVTGLIKANFPSRISFAVTSQVDSRVVLDTPGAEKLLGRGDMLYMASDSSKLARLQGCFVSDKELDRLVNYWKGFVDATPPQLPTVSTISNVPKASVTPSAVMNPPSSGSIALSGLWSDLKAEPKRSEEDELLAQAIQICQDNERASVSLLQRKLRIGYSRAAKLMEILVERGYVSEEEGAPTKGRQVLPPSPPSEPPRSVPKGNSGIIRPATSLDNKATTETRNGGAKKNAAPKSGEQDDLGGFDDWSEEDWADLDKG
ncbi:MAG: DNA translocase FtsK 4TM domain-containing protein [Anaerolineae bacterium]|nr:DNA translocase FtsK 4TM domain-containing protein [Anaerolineae bacterium]